MLQDLDSLAARIGQMVQATRLLQADRDTLRARLKSLEQERNALRDQLARREADHQSIAGRLDQHRAEVESVRAQADAAQAELQVEASRYQVEYEAMRHDLQVSQADSQRLRAVAGIAKERIDAVLMRLPGATQEQN
ncbi:MAG: hypothetical protein EPN46_02170 [Candidimonas sp.]|nr:MAG: hypothetical protein EPN77_05465 [Candidimonas sp.]TAM27150.1 MAG: hypothetical protein EPN62_00415 [Candidimonas sp.]TAM80233.1 MAG: hypothetical protein EPN46_02170 [Candidimonas sp.]